MSLFEGDIVDGIFLFADDIGRKGDGIAEVAHLDAQTQVLRHQVRESARRLVAVAADHGAVAEHGRKAVAVLHHLIGRPMGIDADVEQLHEEVAVAGGDVVGLHDADVVVGGKIAQAFADEIGRDHLVGIEDDRVAVAARLHLVGEEKVVDIARLEPLSVGAPHHAEMVAGGKRVHRRLIFFLRGVV